MTIQRMELMPGVWLTIVRTSKFKSSYWSLRLMTRLSSDTAALNALIPYVLRRGTARLSDLEALSAELDSLYGGEVEPVVYKCGDVQSVGFDASFLDDAYLPEGEGVLEHVAQLLGDFLLHPATRNGRLRREYVKGEQENLMQRIRSRTNDKHSYARHRLVEELYAGEAYGLSRLGTEAQVKKIQPPKLFARYQELLGVAGIELFYCGSAPEKRVEFAFLEALMDLPRNPERELPGSSSKRTSSGEVKRFTERMEVSQGKLEFGYQYGFGMSDPMYPAMMVCNALFGGTRDSRLFHALREEQALCYHVESALIPGKGLMVVSCGADKANFDEVKTLVNKELYAIGHGLFDRLEFASAKQSVIHQLDRMLDDQHLMSLEWQRAAACGEPFDPEHLLQQVDHVTEGDVAAAATELLLRGVYELSGKEENNA